jgi:hypothetical protein
MIINQDVTNSMHFKVVSNLAELELENPQL